MSKQELISEIHGFVSSVDEQYLELFTERQLEDYLTRLRELKSTSQRGTVWVRPAETPAIVYRYCGRWDRLDG